jgi:hypothetical protein
MFTTILSNNFNKNIAISTFHKIPRGNYFATDY